MAFIRTVPEDEATGSLKSFYQRDSEHMGYIANYTKIFSHRPDAYQAWINLNGAIKACMDLRRYELVTLAAARALKSSYCCLAHGNVLRSKFFSDEEVEQLVRDYREAELTDAEVAIMSFAEKVTLHAHQVTQEDVDELRQHGLSDADVLDVVLAASARNFFSRVLDAAGTLPDAAFEDLPDSLRKALTVGRSIEREVARE